jgi:hypothetical protein
MFPEKCGEVQNLEYAVPKLAASPVWFYSIPNTHTSPEFPTVSDSGIFTG